jgi:predicted phosphodiesterase
VSYIFHLGDEYEDLDENMGLIKGKAIYKVPGIFHPKYRDGTLPKRVNVTVENWTFILVHNIDDIPPVSPHADFICFGHTHLQTFQKGEDGIHYLNPGHLKGKVDRNSPASYALLKVSTNEVIVQFKCCEGNVTEEHLAKKHYKSDRHY